MLGVCGWLWSIRIFLHVEAVRVAFRAFRRAIDQSAAAWLHKLYMMRRCAV